jgi:S-adenosylmethionine:tRNA ribosyltransferase-isomerase
MNVDAFDFNLPEDRIALRPASPRDAARMLVVRPGRPVEHAIVRDLPRYLSRGDVLTVNDTKVIAARLTGRRLPRPGFLGAGAKIEATLIRREAPDVFAAFVKPAKRLAAGDRLVLGRDMKAEVTEMREHGEVVFRFALHGPALDAAVALEGDMPLPPYIAGKRKPDVRDRDDYQTVYAAHEGAVASPTAGLHFTPELFARLAAAGVKRETLTLHVGAGTFLPVSVADTADHKMHSEWASLSAETAERLNAARKAGGRIVSVGTTSLRTLESAATKDGVIHPLQGETDIFITPGYRFNSAEVLLTNFHLPRSTLFMLVSAFCGLETMQVAYAEAIREHYRFYSYGDACLLFRDTEAGR